MSGDLLLQPWTNGFEGPRLRASLSSSEHGSTALLPDLHGAVVRRVTSRGIVVTGYEVIARRQSNKSAADHYAQTWWCLVHTIDLARMLDLSDFEDAVPPRSATGF